ncbi:SDR family NAD(P)-dependent oxidoreductase [Sneathiella limimaris]|uniref:SDR family NAD(P)-dependent oxidoreductase n=1 Tax=Sneathiella limimaris TaxID=1964213 RepID=UPI00146F8B3C|nr:SDR family NAD(P)-dependent oxidoreductase [Sneathiella limimaris]
MSLRGNTAFVTGATGGIGVPLCQELEARQVHVVRYDRKEHGDLVKNLEGVSRSLQELKPDILVNLAGMNSFAMAEDQDYERIIQLNLTVPMRLCQALLPIMKRQGSGQLVTVGSMTGLIPLPHLTGYVAAKAGLKAFSDALRRESIGTGVSVTHLAPRAVKTAMNKGIADTVNQRTKTNYDHPDQVARRMVKAIENREAEVRFGLSERIFATLNFLTPGLVDKGLETHTEIGRQELNGAHGVLVDPVQ